ncbi:hypothetical protein M501DRAFT_925105 [Patellaria atrata CBS 101060]|uniref:BTB domain-containing protein n=1 Tax=Patellaria atrata CBS 101060 TaxID=1346257 RepID=A0A9P4SIR4_9PEZI|nr:hypothetical protein M501DRAFT_925105 [Patellaria atrata CBS 101060]
MAPYTADTARPTSTKNSRPTPIIPRIIPAVPLAFSRPTYPKQRITPEDAPESTPERNLSVNGQEVEQDTVTASRHELHTPESKAFVGDRNISDTPGHDEEVSLPELHPGVAKADIEDAYTGHKSAIMSSVSPPTNSMEFPPPFVPAGLRSRPPSTASITFPQFPPSGNNHSMHHPRPSINSVVFGGYADSSSSSPAPPHSAGPPHYPPHPASFINPPFPPHPFFPPGHMHHLSDPHMMYPPMGMGPQGLYPISRDQHHPPQFGRSSYTQNGQIPYPMANQHTFPPPFPISPIDRGVSGSQPGSQASSAHNDNEVINPPQHPSQQFPVMPTGERLNHVPLQNGFVTPNMAAQKRLIREQQSLREYLVSQFGTHDFADYILELSESRMGSRLFALPVHGIIIARSPRLLRVIQEHANNPAYADGRKILKVQITDRFCTGEAFADALKFLYGGELLETGMFTSELENFDSKTGDLSIFGIARQRMDGALAYVAAGYFLGISDITARGLKIAKELLRWDTVEQVLDFTLAAGFENFEPRDPASNLSTSQQDKSENELPTQMLAYGKYGDALLTDIVDFLCSNIPPGFNFINSVPELRGIPRLPIMEESRPSTANPRLSRIQFGDLPATEITQMSFITRILSSIFLSLPFSVLRSIFSSQTLNERLPTSEVLELLRSVVAERESRRQRAIRGPLSNDVPYRVLQNLDWEESVKYDTQDSPERRLNRSYVGAGLQQ